MRRHGVLRDGEQLCMTAIQGSCMLACVWEIRLEKQEELSSSATSTSKLFPTSGSLYLMFPLPRPLFMATSVSCFRQHKCHLLRKAFSDIRTQSKHPGYFFNNNFMFIQSIIILLTWLFVSLFPSLEYKFHEGTGHISLVYHHISTLSQVAQSLVCNQHLVNIC